MHRSLDEIRSEGLAALKARLGRAGMIRFLQQFEQGHGDYTKDRREWAATVTIKKLGRASRPKHRRRTSGK